MRKLILTLIIILCATKAYGYEKVNQYDNRGNHNGYYIIEDNKVKKYDKHNDYDGYYVQKKKTIKEYDRRGNYKNCYKKVD